MQQCRLKSFDPENSYAFNLNITIQFVSRPSTGHKCLVHNYKFPLTIRFQILHLKPSVIFFLFISHIHYIEQKITNFPHC